MTHLKQVSCLSVGTEYNLLILIFSVSFKKVKQANGFTMYMLSLYSFYLIILIPFTLFRKEKFCKRRIPEFI